MFKTKNLLRIKIKKHTKQIKQNKKNTLKKTVVYVS